MPPSANSNLLLFLSDVLSPDADRKESLVAYRVGPHSDNQGLTSVLRAGKPVLWSNAFSFAAVRLNGLPFKFTDFDPNALPQDADFEVLAPGVLQMVVGFQLYPDNLPVVLADGSTPNPDKARGQIVYSAPTKSVVSTSGNPASTYIDLSRVSSLVVGLVAIDTPNLKLLTEDDTRTLAGAFPTPAQEKLPVESWTPVLTNLASSGPGPLPARQSVRVYHRFFPINPFGAKQR